MIISLGYRTWTFLQFVSLLPDAFLSESGGDRDGNNLISLRFIYFGSEYSRKE